VACKIYGFPNNDDKNNGEYRKVNKAINHSTDKIILVDIWSD
jgi:hypothetical protein